MLLFNEGIPRSGKSFEAVSRHIAGALRKRRGVTAYIEGLNHEKIAPLVGLTVEECRELLQVLARDQVREWWKVARDNDLVVLDEIANVWHNKAKMSEDAAGAFKEHGHRGQDLLLADQDLRDVHAIIRRRVEMKFCFLKLSALGAESRYSVTTYRHKGADEFERLATETRRYDKAWFGTYASHTNESVQTGNYKDKRGELFGTWSFRLGIPLCLAATLLGGVKIWTYLHPEPVAKPSLARQTDSSLGSASSAGAVAVAPARSASAPARVPEVQETYLADLSSRYRVRLAGLLAMGGRADGVVEWLDGTRVAERLTFEQLRQLGASLVVSQGMVRVYLGDWKVLATMWPVEVPGIAGAAVVEASKGQPEPTQPHQPQAITLQPRLPISKGQDMSFAGKPV